jgi:16S rRNA (guanine527-N7)-methyltransferase
VSLRDIKEVLTARAGLAGIVIPDALATRLIVYYQLLAHWNRKINLTSLSDPDEAVDRLLLEPVAAAARLPRCDLVDLGSGGGSPGVPLALSLDVRRIVLVESRVRKAAFLREVLRELGLAGSVEAARFEDVASSPAFAGVFGLASVRAVRMDEPTFAAVSRFLRPEGQAALFRSLDAPDSPAGLPPSLQWISTTALIPASRSSLTILQKV